MNYAGFPRDQNRKRMFAGMASAAALLVSSAAYGDFKGSDSLALDSGNWNVIGFAGNGWLYFQNSRLEYYVQSPEGHNSAIAVWKPNRGSYKKDWFVQADLHLERLPLPFESFVELGLNVEGTSEKTKYFSMVMSRIQGADFERNRFIVRDSVGEIASVDSESRTATFRVHFDASSEELVGSIHDGKQWRYSPPHRINDWEMGSGDEFLASMFAHNGAVSGETAGLQIGSGSAYFTNFKAGPAEPEIAIYRSNSKKLVDGKSKLTFGKIPAKRKGKPEVVWINNEGTAPLENLKVVTDGLNGEEFQVGLPESTVLSPGGWTKFKITFRPKEKGLRSATLRLKSNDKDEATFDLKLIGKGK